MEGHDILRLAGSAPYTHPSSTVVWMESIHILLSHNTIPQGPGIESMLTLGGLEVVNSVHSSDYLHVRTHTHGSCLWLHSGNQLHRTDHVKLSRHTDAHNKFDCWFARLELVNKNLQMVSVQKKHYVLEVCLLSVISHHWFCVNVG